MQTQVASRRARRLRVQGRHIRDVHRGAASEPIRDPRCSRLRAARRIVVLAALILLVDLVVSFWGAMAGPSNTSFGVRAVERPARQRCRGRGVGRRGHLRLAERAGDRRAAAQAGSRRSGTGALGPGRGLRDRRRLPRRSRPHSRAKGQRRANRAPWAPATRPFWSRPSGRTLNYPQLVAGGVARISTTRGTRGWPFTRAVTSRPTTEVSRRRCSPAAFESAGDVQQRLQARGLSWWLLLAGSCVYAALTDGQATLIGYSGGVVDVRTWDWRFPSWSGDRLRAPEPAADRR